MTDEELLSTIPDFMVFGMMAKAIPATEGMDRIIYVEASSESQDLEGEIILAKALKDSSDYFLKFGIIDLDHKSMPNVAQKLNLVAEEWAIGQPLEVRFSGDTTVVRAKLYSGDTPLAEKANNVWEGLTKLNPPARYYASVGGHVLSREIRIDKDSGNRIPVVTKTRWNNLALSAAPVNPHLSTASAAPLGVFAKSLNGYVMKSLQAGYGTDSATLTGGAALRTQSFDSGISGYADFRARLVAAIRAHKVGRDVITYALRTFDLSHDQAAEWTEKFLHELEIKRRAAKH